MTRARLLAAAAVVLLLALVTPLVLRSLLAYVAGGRVRALAAGRGLDVRWQNLRAELPARVGFDHFVGTSRAAGDTVFAVDSLWVELDPWALTHGSARVSRLVLARAEIAARGHAAADTAEEPAPRASDDPAKARALRRAADSVVRLLAAPARDLPRLALSDVVVRVGEDAPLPSVRIAWLDLAPRAGGVRLATAGALLEEPEIPFAATLDYAADDRLSGGMRLDTTDPTTGGPWPLLVTIDGALAQDRRAGRVALHDTTRVTIGRIAFRAGASLTRQGPTVKLALEAADLDETRLKRSLPPSLLGPLAGVGVRGSWDWRLDFALDLSAPDSVRFRSDVTPHDLALDPARTRLKLFSLDEPFVAEIHLPRDRIVTRELSDANPDYRPLAVMSPALVGAVVANEDGGFFRHRGFNSEAVRQSIAENLRAGAYRRGAGTITMQLARNLYLGHRRTLARKFQEVVLAWTLEHLAGVSKERLLEIYLNIIEWGPDVQGAGEAARWYFAQDAASLDVSQGLFLATLVPSPARWTRRLDASGGLRPSTRAQMHFIGRAMVAKGWLDPAALPPADSLRIELRGPARLVLFPPDSTDYLKLLPMTVR